MIDLKNSSLDYSTMEPIDVIECDVVIVGSGAGGAGGKYVQGPVAQADLGGVGDVAVVLVGSGPGVLPHPPILIRGALQREPQQWLLAQRLVDLVIHC